MKASKTKPLSRESVIACCAIAFGAVAGIGGLYAHHQWLVHKAENACTPKSIYYNGIDCLNRLK